MGSRCAATCENHNHHNCNYPIVGSTMSRRWCKLAVIVFLFGCFDGSSAFVVPSNNNHNNRRRAFQSQTKQMASIAPPSPSSSQHHMSDFERRMRNLISTRPKKKTHSSNHGNIRTVDTLNEYRSIVGNEKNKIVVVRFFATWCKACQAITPLYRKMSRQPSFSNIVFVDVPVTDTNSNLHQGLHVPSLPYGHIYHPTAGLVEECKISRKFFSDFQRKLGTYVSGECQIDWESDASPYDIAATPTTTATISSSLPLSDEESSSFVGVYD
eukprot:CAMPEP_0118721580 /NCGR_PEP_ID=MMETSP0800-20121206/30812_1 /TAXON_ID=210618 ORGANISM="Striatella unipunctata, Strain CCMP2910" /NCGR_SAMPLE_ID=MMETSP0800 /ASSEMBLY_ACC=CAM_ASM_000638 /LENGTH=268 /DNA_ID=CAMNT_0006629481 /DNA_START=12 /DNA_END=818 /DNA_ORIENTATION=+